MKADLYLKNGLIVTEERIFPGGIVVMRGKIAQLFTSEAQIEAKEVIDLEGKIVLPGLVDDHVHFNEPGRTHWEGYHTGSMAAAAGGVTTVLEMPLNAIPPSIDQGKLAVKREAIQQEPVVDYAHWGGLVDNNLDALEGLDAAGVVGFKAFMSASGVEFERIDDDVLYAGLLRTRHLGNLVGVHAENEYVTAMLGRELREAGRVDRAAWCESRPPAAELEAINRAIHWAKAAEGNLHIVHVTLADGIRSAEKAKQEGVHVTVETCPHYLFFDQDDFIRIGPAAKCAPPIRSRTEVDRLWECVLAGKVDTIASDHSPCTWEEKEPGLDNIWKAWGGVSGVQTTLPVMLTEGVHKRGLALTDLVRMLSTNPARLFGLYPQKGTLLPGADADLVIIDLDREWRLEEDDLFYKNKHSPYIGYTFKGAVERTMVRGVTVYQNGQIMVPPGFGRLLLRKQRYDFFS